VASPPKKKTNTKKKVASKASKKAVPAKKKRSKKATKKSPAKKTGGFRSKLWSFLWRLMLFLAVPFLLYVLYLDLVITKRFEGQKWALPAHVYSRPLDIYVGRELSRDSVLTELSALGYQKRNSLDEVVKPGEYSETPLSIVVYLRKFEFWDGVQESSKVEVLWDANRIDDMRVGGELIADVRLEPRLFGSVSPMSHEDRSLITIDDTPQALIDGLIAVEDRKFYSHWGIDPLGIGRAFVTNVRAGRAVQGGSTLTQQLVKNYFLTDERKLKRKLIEMVMAFLLEIHYSKDEILQAYLNEVHLGQSGNRAIHGFGLASQFLFGRPLNELEVHELATLAGMVKAPSSYNPLRNPERSTKRRDLVLDVMVDQGVLSKEVAEQQKLKSLKAVAGKATKALKTHPAFSELVRDHLRNDYAADDLSAAGLKIFTTLDPAMQTSLNDVIETELNAISTQRNFDEDELQVAAITVRTDNGEVVALAGSKDPVKAGFNRALRAKRPVGSLLKPMVALSAMQAEPQRFQLNTNLRDEEMLVSQAGAKDWQPQNYDKQFLGEVLMIDALSKSRNVPIVGMGLEVGISRVADDLAEFGLSPKPRALPSLILGAVDSSVYDVAQLYLTLASGGFRTPLRAVRSVQTVDGEALDRYPLDIEQVAEPVYANLISYALQEVLRSGTARGFKGKVSKDLGLAVKTGTTDGYRDSWFAGFSGDLLTVVWVGRDDNKTTGLTGASGAGRVWFEYMSKLPLKPLYLDLSTDIVETSVPTYSSEMKIYSCEESRLLPVLESAVNSPSSLSCESSEYIDEQIVDDSPSPLWAEKKSALDRWIERIFR